MGGAGTEMWRTEASCTRCCMLGIGKQFCARHHRLVSYRNRTTITAFTSTLWFAHMCTDAGTAIPVGIEISACTTDRTASALEHVLTLHLCS